MRRQQAICPQRACCLMLLTSKHQLKQTCYRPSQQDQWWEYMQDRTKRWERQKEPSNSQLLAYGADADCDQAKNCKAHWPDQNACRTALLDKAWHICFPPSTGDKNKVKTSVFESPDINHLPVAKLHCNFLLQALIMSWCPDQALDASNLLSWTIPWCWGKEDYWQSHLAWPQLCMKQAKGFACSENWLYTTVLFDEAGRCLRWMLCFFWPLHSRVGGGKGGGSSKYHHFIKSWPNDSPKLPFCSC